MSITYNKPAIPKGDDSVRFSGLPAPQGVIPFCRFYRRGALRPQPRHDREWRQTARDRK